MPVTSVRPPLSPPQPIAIGRWVDGNCLGQPIILNSQGRVVGATTTCATSPSFDFRCTMIIIINSNLFLQRLAHLSVKYENVQKYGTGLLDPLVVKRIATAQQGLWASPLGAFRCPASYLHFRSHSIPISR